MLEPELRGIAAVAAVHELELQELAVADAEAREPELRELVAAACYPIPAPCSTYQPPTELHGWHGSFD